MALLFQDLFQSVSLPPNPHSHLYLYWPSESTGGMGACLNMASAECSAQLHAHHFGSITQTLFTPQAPL